MNNKERAIEFSRELIKNATPAELELKKKLEKEQIPFRFQRAIPKGTFKKGFYIPDFTLKFKINKAVHYLYVEIEGGYHKGQISKDISRERRLIKNYKNFIVYFTNEDIFNNIDLVIEKIISYRNMELRY